MMLTPWTGNLVCEGKITYSERSRAWSVIRLHKDILNEFPTLKNRRAKLSFMIEHVRTVENLKAKVKEIERANSGIPLLLYLYLDDPLNL